MTRIARTIHHARLLAGVAVLVAVVALSAACSSSTKTSGGGGTSASTGGSNAVAVKNFSFEPQKLSVPVGTKVTWTFDDSAKHNVTASDQSFKSTDLSSGATYSFTFNKAGTYNYICTIHQYMTGSVTVK